MYFLGFYVAFNVEQVISRWVVLPTNGKQLPTFHIRQGVWIADFGGGRWVCYQRAAMAPEQISSNKPTWRSNASANNLTPPQKILDSTIGCGAFQNFNQFYVRIKTNLHVQFDINLCSFFHILVNKQTDRRTDRQTDRQTETNNHVTSLVNVRTQFISLFLKQMNKTGWMPSL